MPADSFILAIVTTPFIMALSLTSLVIFKRGFQQLEYVVQAPKSTLNSVSKTLKPYCKTLYEIITRYWDGEVKINSQSILLVTIVVALLTVIYEISSYRTEEAMARKKAEKENKK